jgi:ATPase subunit of ABC transporter with duplicated ATPase domains
VAKEVRNRQDNDKAQRGFRIDRTEKLASKARQTDRALAALEEIEKPWEGWDLRFVIEQAERAGAVVARLHEGVVERGGFRLGPLDLEIAWGDRLGVTGANGSGKSTLVGAILGTLPLASGERWIGPSVVTGVLGQDRRALGGERDLVRAVCDRCGLVVSEARSLLAKFGLGAEQVTRPAGTLSPGERTRAELATFQALGVNFLVLDEPTNHLDLPAIEQLESALASFSGTLLLVSHDRRMLESVELTRTLHLEDAELGRGETGEGDSG